MSAYRMKPPMHGLGIRAGHPLATGLELFVPFWEGKSSPFANDVTQNQHVGTLTNGPTWESGPRGGRMKFDGVNQYVTVPMTVPTTAVTMMCVFATRGTADDDRICGSRGAAGDQHGYLLYYNDADEKIYMVVDSSAGYVQAASAIAITDTETHIVVGTWDGANIVCYLDGTPGTPQANAGNLVGLPAEFQIANAVQGSAHWRDSIEAVALWSRALSEGEVLPLTADPYALITPPSTMTLFAGMGGAAANTRRYTLPLLKVG